MSSNGFTRVVPIFLENVVHIGSAVEMLMDCHTVAMQVTILI